MLNNMIYSKRNPPKNLVESLTPPEWANPTHAEQVRVDPSKARTVSEIIARYSAGILPQESDYGEPEFGQDPNEINAEDTEYIMDQPDAMDADCTDINDLQNVQNSIADRVEKNRSIISEALRKHSEPNFELQSPE